MSVQTSIACFGVVFALAMLAVIKALGRIARALEKRNWLERE